MSFLCNNQHIFRRGFLNGLVLLVLILQMTGCSSLDQVEGPLNNADTGREMA